jgi:hypothetical protein
MTVGFVASGNPKLLPPTATGKICSALIHTTDWLPTLCDPALGNCDLTGASGGLKGLPLDGVSAWGAIARGEPGRRTEIMHDLWYGLQALSHMHALQHRAREARLICLPD